MSPVLDRVVLLPFSRRVAGPAEEPEGVQMDYGDVVRGDGGCRNPLLSEQEAC